MQKKLRKQRTQPAVHHTEHRTIRTPHKFLKAYLAGLAFPATILSVLVPLGLYFDLPLRFLYYIPLAPPLWGFWNLLSIEFVDASPLRHHLGLSGAILGFLLALFAVFIAKIPQYVLGDGSPMYAPILIIPALYYLAWRFIVHSINKRLGLHD